MPTDHTRTITKFPVIKLRKLKGNKNTATVVTDWVFKSK